MVGRRQESRRIKEQEGKRYLIKGRSNKDGRAPLSKETYPARTACSWRNKKGTSCLWGYIGYLMKGQWAAERINMHVRRFREERTIWGLRLCRN